MAEHIREYVATDGRDVIVASNGGAKRLPAWYLNLVEDPTVRVQVAGDRFSATAREETAEERPALWKLMTSLKRLPATGRTLQRQGGREIPVVILEPERSEGLISSPAWSA